MRIFGVISFIKPLNDTLTTVKWSKMRRITRTLITIVAWYKSFYLYLNLLGKLILVLHPNTIHTLERLQSFLSQSLVLQLLTFIR